MNKTLIGTALGGILLGAVATTTLETITYKSIKISDPAKTVVEQFSQEWGLTQQDTVSKIVLDYSALDASTTDYINNIITSQQNWINDYNNWKLDYEDWKTNFEEWKVYFEELHAN